VIGLDLCPFARAVYERGLVRVVVSDAAEPTDAVKVALEEARRLLDTDPSDLSTTVVAFSRTLTDFDTFLDAAATLEAVLADAGAEGVLQVATFHPDYQFEGTDPDAVSSYTNRAPAPIFHLLREAEVALAVEGHPNPAAIPEANVARLESMGAEAIAELWRRFE